MALRETPNASAILSYKKQISGLPWAILSAPHARVFGRVRAWRLDLWIAVGASGNLRVVNIPGGQRAVVMEEAIAALAGRLTSWD